MVGLLWCLNLFKKRLERGTNVQLKKNSQDVLDRHKEYVSNTIITLYGDR